MTDRTSIYIGQALRRLLDDRPEDKGLRGAAKAAKSQQFSRDVTQRGLSSFPNRTPSPSVRRHAACISRTKPLDNF